jgi:hypothetical protein
MITWDIIVVISYELSLSFVLAKTENYNTKCDSFMWITWIMTFTRSTDVIKIYKNGMSLLCLRVFRINAWITLQSLMWGGSYFLRDYLRFMSTITKYHTYSYIQIPVQMCVNWKIYFPIFNQTNNSNVFKCLIVTKWNTSTQAVHKICVTAGLPCPKNAEDGSQGCIVRTLFVGAAQTLGRARHHFHDESKMYPYPSLE